MAKLSLKVQKISDALDLVPVSKRDCVEHAVANALGEGLDRLIGCFQAFESKYANNKHHETWLCAFKQGISESHRWIGRKNLEYLPHTVLHQAVAHANPTLLGKICHQ